MANSNYADYWRIRLFGKPVGQSDIENPMHFEKWLHGNMISLILKINTEITHVPNVKRFR